MLGFCFWSLFCNVLQSSRLVTLLLIVNLLSCDCYCHVSLHHGAVGWSVAVAFPGNIHLSPILYATFVCIIHYCTDAETFVCNFTLQKNVPVALSR